ncbi:MAG: hypothetical protein E7421_02550 [Ruminococcaceae bacterium]|nr:hypothetical protein [Oscillospiraceae bacterium]
MKKVTVTVVALLLIMLMCACEQTKEQVCSHTYSKASCTQASKCTKCGIASGTALGHAFSVASCDEPATCSRCGKTDGTASGHSYTKATCTEPEKCTKCGITNGVATGHSFNTATCQAPQTCTVCGATEGSKADHDYKLGDNGADQCSMCGNQGYYSYSILAVKKHIESLKNPDSIKVYSVYAGYYNRSYNENESGDYIAVIVDASGTNSYGGVVRSDYICLFDYKNNKVIYDLEGQGEYIKENYYGNAALQGYDLMIEAQKLSANKTALQKQNHEYILDMAKQMAGLG